MPNMSAEAVQVNKFLGKIVEVVLLHIDIAAAKVTHPCEAENLVKK
jgi:hypothetical protein